MIEIFYLDKEIKKCSIKDIGTIKSKNIWIDATAITKEESKQLTQKLSIHPLSAEDLVSSNVRIKAESFDEYLFCVFYAIKKEKILSLVEMDFILGKNYLITNHKTNLNSFTELKNNPDRLKNLFSKGNDYVFHYLLDKEIDNFIPELESIDDEIEKLEDEITKKPSPENLKKILRLKRLIVSIKKITLPQREKIGFIAKNESKFLSKNIAPYLRDVYDHAIRISDMIDNYREAVSNTFDIYMSTVSNNMNEVMKVLSIIATIALPLTVISGVYGTNFDILPGKEFIYGFWAMILAMAVLSAGMIYFFKKKKWF